MANLFCFGLGFSALTLARELREAGWSVAGTCRTVDKQSMLRKDGIDAVLFDGSGPISDTANAALRHADHLLISAPPGAEGDPVLKHAGEDIRAVSSNIQWVGYLSTTGVYGDTGGIEVSEDSPLNPTSRRSELRVAAETGWLEFGRALDIPVHIFRLAGIYGPGRSVLDQLRAGTARRVDKPGHRFSRIHVTDIAKVLCASMARPRPGAIYNVCDDEPAAQADVVAYGAKLLGQVPPRIVPFDEARESMSKMALSFWRDNRTVSNARIKSELGVTLSCPTYREGLTTVQAAGG